MKDGVAGAKRSYQMTSRAEAATANGERILDAAVAAFWDLPYAQVSLDEIARRADVSAQTVIRRFGGRDGLLAAAAERESERAARQRDETPAGDLAAAARMLVEHYEVLGDRVLKMLAEEDRVPALSAIADRGRALHREWCARVFAAGLESRSGAERRRRLAQFVAVCDVYMWKLLRGDAGLSRRQTELALVELLEPMMEGT
jgi:AcrR family transcriptional regulator